MVRGMTVLLVCQLAGEVTARALDLPMPGPVLGMLLLFAFCYGAARRTGSIRSGRDCCAFYRSFSCQLASVS